MRNYAIALAMSTASWGALYSLVRRISSSNVSIIISTINCLLASWLIHGKETFPVRETILMNGYFIIDMLRFRDWEGSPSTKLSYWIHHLTFLLATPVMVRYRYLGTMLIELISYERSTAFVNLRSCIHKLYGSKDPRHLASAILMMGAFFRFRILTIPRILSELARHQYNDNLERFFAGLVVIPIGLNLWWFSQMMIRAAAKLKRE